ncbi:IS200/IS605 family transposase [Granulosicoccus sp. 3-233]|uniref:IS200/IS605 family transposase n=1 Tax=Granulosicoccus sp. 3-233 TaxID=3417969 RepID=UPI003D34600A
MVWTAKYRYQVLAGDVELRTRELLRELAQSQEMVIHVRSINRDHAHVLISIPPQLSVSQAVQFMKGKSSHRLLSEFAILKKRYWGQHVRARGYWVCSSGNVTDQMWKEYIKNQKPLEPDDEFNVMQGESKGRPYGRSPDYSGNPKPPGLASAVFTYISRHYSRF